MNTKTFIYRFDAITFELTELRKYWQNHDRNASADNALAKAIELSQSADTDVIAREMLFAILTGLRNRAGQAISADDSRQVMISRVLANCYRAEGKFYEAEQFARREPTQSVITLAVLASDIRAQKDPQRNPEVLSIYIKALKTGFEELEHTIWPSNVRAEIASIYVSLADLLLEMQIPGGVESQLENLIAFNNKCVAEYNISSGVPYQMLDAFKLTIAYARQFMERGMTEPAAHLIEKALEMAALALRQTNYDIKVVRFILEVWGETLGTLEAGKPALFSTAPKSSPDQTTNVSSVRPTTSSCEIPSGRRFYRF